MQRFLIVLLTAAAWIAPSLARADWPAKSQGTFDYYPSGFEHPTGKCKGKMTLQVSADRALENVVVDVADCRTVDRHTFTLGPFSMNGDDWVWKDGKGYFQGKLSGLIGDDRLLIQPWVFGLRLEVQKKGVDQLRVSLGFEHNNERLTFAGTLNVEARK